MDNNFTIGKYHYVQLKNGLKIIVQPIKTAPVVSIQFAVTTGSIHENPAGHGLSHFLEHMIFKGSENFPGKNDISDEVQRHGGYINAYTSKDHTCYYIDSVSDKWKEMTELLIDAVTKPLFPEEEFITEKDVILNEQSMYEDKPNWHLQQESWRVAAGTHPFGIPVIGYRDKIAEVSREMMINYYNRRYQPNNSTIVVVGDVDVHETVSLITETLDDWKNQTIEPIVIPNYCRKEFSDNRDIFYNDNQARVMITYNLATGLETDIPALDVIETILSGSQSSLLVNRLKKKEDIAITVGAFSYTIPHAGIFACSASAVPEKLPKAENKIFEVMDDLLTGNIKIEEVKKAVLKNKISFLKQMQTVNSRAQLFVTATTGFDSPNFWEPYLKRLEEVDIKQIQEVAQKYLKPENAVVVRQWPEGYRNEVEKKLDPSKVDKINSFDKELLPESKVRLISLNRENSPLTNICIVFPDGSFIDPVGKSGCSFLLGRVLGAGAGNMNEEQLLEFLDSNGITITFSPGNNTLCCDLSYLPENEDIALKAFSDVLLKPPFDENVFNRERSNMIQLIESKNKKVFAPGMKAFATALFGESHPYSKTPDGTIESLQNISIDDLKAMFKSLIRKDEIVISVAGDLKNKSSLVSKLDEIMNSLESFEGEIVKAEEPNFEGAKESFLVDLKQEQALVILGVPGCRAIDANRHVLNLILASLNGQSSRIFKVVREDNGLAYDTGALTKLGHHKGHLMLYALTDPRSTSEVLDLLQTELDKLGSEGLTKEEFELAKLQIVSEKAFSSQENKAVIFNSAINEYYGLGHNSYFEELDKIKAMTFENFNNEVKQLFSQTRQISVIAGNKERMNNEK